MHKLFIPTKNLEALMPIYENRSNHIGYLLYWFVSHFNGIKELDLHEQTVSSSKYKIRKYLEKFS